MEPTPRMIMMTRHLIPLTLLLLAVAACERAGPEDVVERYYEHLDAGALDEARALHSDEMEAFAAAFGVALEEEVEAEAAAIQEAGGVRRVRTETVAAYDPRATVRATVELGDGSRSLVEWSVVREDGRWLLVEGVVVENGPLRGTVPADADDLPAPAPIVEEDPITGDPLEDDPVLDLDHPVEDDG